MRTSSCKAKGRRLCLKVKEELHTWAPDLQPDDIMLPAGSQPGRDIHLSPAAKALYPLAIECKMQESLNIWAALKQAQTHAEGSTDVPLLCFSRNREPKVYVALDLQDFLKLIR